MENTVRVNPLGIKIKMIMSIKIKIVLGIFCLSMFSQISNGQVTTRQVEGIAVSDTMIISGSRNAQNNMRTVMFPISAIT